jgi:hypothetical protein
MKLCSDDTINERGCCCLGQHCLQIYKAPYCCGNLKVHGHSLHSMRPPLFFLVGAGSNVLNCPIRL